MVPAGGASSQWSGLARYRSDGASAPHWPVDAFDFLATVWWQLRLAQCLVQKRPVSRSTATDVDWGDGFGSTASGDAGDSIPRGGELGRRYSRQ